MSTPATTRLRKASTHLANYTGTSFADGVNNVLTAGNVITQAQLDALTVPVFELDESFSPKDTTRGGRAVFYGNAANDTVHEYRAWAAYLIEGSTDTANCYLLKLICSGTFRLGQMTGKNDANSVKTTERFADTLTTPVLGTTATNPKGNGDTMVAAFAGLAPSVDSPADDTVGVLFLPELGNPTALIFDLKAASGGINVLFQRDT